MNRKCIREHNGNYPQDDVVFFCTKVDCDKRFACARCHHDYHSDHFASLQPINDLYLFINNADQFGNQAMILNEQLEIVKTQLIKNIEFLCKNIQQDFVIPGDAVTEEMLNRIIKANNYGSLKKMEDLIEDFQYTNNAFKYDIRIQRDVQIVEDRAYRGFTYSGEVVDDQMHGTGTAIQKNGDIYHGQWRKGKRWGYGIRSRANGNQQLNHMKENSRMIKYMEKVYINGLVARHMRVNIKTMRKMDEENLHGLMDYEGGFKDDQMHGIGVYKKPNGKMYNGEYKANKKNGRGVESYANGEIYEGEYRENKKNGRGVYRWPNGDMYDGDWVKGKKTGYGKFTYSNGNIEKGKWKKDLKQGNHEFYVLRKTTILTYKDSEEIKKIDIDIINQQQN